jgi:hypothetical protein
MITMMQERGKLSKPIPITPENQSAIAAALSEAAGRIGYRYTGSDVERAAKDAERRLDQLRIPQANRAGAALYLRPPGPSAKAYKYAQNTIEVQIQRRSDGDWALTHTARSLVYPQQPGASEMFLTEKQRDVALDRGMKAIEQQFSVQEPKQPKPQPQRAPEQGVGIGG